VDVEWSKVERFYQQIRPITNDFSIGIHVGAQWRSKQYPHAAKLAEILRRTYPVQIIAGPNDQLPEGIAEKNVNRLVNGDLAKALISNTYVVANDSGPMHAAALLRCRTLVVTNHAAMKEWLPPTVVSIGSDPCQGYRPRKYRPSDTSFSDWPSAQEVAESLYNQFRSW
jgi:ADP-heptose:LPS heptosyltransferase